MSQAVENPDFHSNDGNGKFSEPVMKRDSCYEQEELSPNVNKGSAMVFGGDPTKQIDFVLVWTSSSDEPKAEKQLEKRKARDTFENRLRKQGLELKHDLKEGRTQQYTLIHAPFDVLCFYAELMKLRMPIKKAGEVTETTGWWDKFSNFSSCCTRLFKHSDEDVPFYGKKFTHTFDRDKIYLYDIPENKNDFFSRGIRSRIVDYILRWQRYADGSAESQKSKFGIRRLIADKAYLDAYPLHEGRPVATAKMSMRKLLALRWANWRSCLKLQPLTYIRVYFGEKIAIYFVWLGYYTYWLIPASIVGLMVFIYGIVMLKYDVVAHESCDPSGPFTMCPMCNARCGYWNYNQICREITLTRVFDNWLTLFFAVFMSLWGTFYLEFWKREEATIQCQWNMTNFEEEEEPSRPEYESFIDNFKGRTRNRTLPFWRRQVPVYCCSFVSVLLLCLVAIAFVVGVVFYRISVLAALYLTDNPIIYHNAVIVVSVTAAIINLVSIFFLNFVYVRLATKLTDWEHRRTQSEYDGSLTLKLYCLQFVNYYSSLFYIAFVKGRFTGTPASYQTFFGARQEECQGGCFAELCIQLVIVFVGKQLLDNLLEILLPRLKRWFVGKYCRKDRVDHSLMLSPWERDFLLEPIGHIGLFKEYLEIMIQFGFVTLFVAAFPLAPVFALLNNMIELRADANKFLTQYRRPVASRARSIGVWFNILYGISRLAILTNAVIIAFTSQTVDRYVYRLFYSETGSLHGFVNHTLSYFDVRDFPNGVAPNPEEIKPEYNGTTMCRYFDYRHPPWSSEKYTYTALHWHNVASRFIFVVCFENIVILLTSLIDYIIPDIPKKLKKQIRQETIKVNETIILTELERAHLSHRESSLDNTEVIQHELDRLVRVEESQNNDISDKMESVF